MQSETYNHYWQKGWAVMEGVFSREEADRIAQIALEVSTREMQESEDSYVVDASAGGETAPRKIDTPFLKRTEFQAFVMDRRLTQAVERILGAPPLLSGDQVFMKPPHFGSAKPYHQDNFYFQCDPGDHVITAWIALDDVREENGCLRYIDGSHKGPILPHEAVPGEPYNLVPPPELIDLDKESLALVRKGGVVFHHSQALHTSHRNESDQWRRGYATHWVTSEVTSSNGTLDKAYFRREDYPVAV
ncbi:MAG: phytanoyl-CoA dioxygenase family protein [Caldilineaceae bacterium]|nr:phytanoyl-CoA dioxygenase family protein [Caldilineaceae bacterium]